MEFNVVYILTIYDDNRENFTSGHRETKLPFAPISGLEVLNNGVGFGPIKMVRWDENENLFRCYLEYEVEPLHIDDDIGFQIEKAKMGGFKGFKKIYETPTNS